MEHSTNEATLPAYARFERVGRRRCERSSTVVLATLCPILLAFALAACGGSQKPKPYQKAVSGQEACCNQLADAAARQQCTSNIVRVDDASVQESAANRATYACIEKHFVCDPTSGTATKESSQEQLDCINDIRD